MKKILLVSIYLFAQSTHAMLVEFVEQGVTTNHFLSEYGGGTCPASSSTATTDCENPDIANVIGTNFAAAPMKTLGTYIIYNNFGKYISEMSAALNSSLNSGIDKTPDSVDNTLNQAEESMSSGDYVRAQVLTSGTIDDYPAVGIYQIEISTSKAVQDQVTSAPGLTTTQAGDGRIKLVVRLRYNGGASGSEDPTQQVYLWSQDAAYVGPTDSFKIIVSNDKDMTLLSPNDTSDNIASKLSTYFKFNDPRTDSCPAYDLAVNSPRMIRLQIT